MKLNTSITFQVLESIQTPKLVRDYEKWEWKPHTTHSKSRIGGQLSTVNREVMGQEWTGMTSGKLRIGDFPGAGCARIWYCQKQESSVYGEVIDLSKGWPRKQSIFTPPPGKAEVLLQLLQAACMGRQNADPVQLDERIGLNCKAPSSGSAPLIPVRTLEDREGALVWSDGMPQSCSGCVPGVFPFWAWW